MDKTDLPMRVSFDLDEVLFVDPVTHRVEPPLAFPFGRLYQERLRLGTPTLIHALQSEGFEVWVYTSSFRSERYIKGLFRRYGVRFDGIINGQRHENEVQRGHARKMPTKLPNRYRIALHVDDEDIVCSYGRTYGFEVFHLDAQDDDWCDKILARVRQIKALRQRRQTAP